MYAPTTTMYVPTAASTVYYPSATPTYTERQYWVAKPVVETSEREEKVIVRKPVIETSQREEKVIVRKPVIETADREEVRTVYKRFMKPPSRSNASSSTVLSMKMRCKQLRDPVHSVCSIPTRTDRLVQIGRRCPSRATHLKSSRSRAGANGPLRAARRSAQSARHGDEVRSGTTNVQGASHHSKMGRRRADRTVPVTTTRYEEQVEVRKVPVTTTRTEYEQRTELVPTGY